MKIGIIGATGKAGRAITQEALRRGYQVTAIVRDENKLSPEEKQHVHVVQKDLFDLTPADLAPFDVVIDAFNAPTGQEEEHQTSLKHLIQCLNEQKKPRLLVVGGAGSLFVDPDKQLPLMNTDGFPKAFLPTATNMAKGLQLLQHSNINWTYLSPAAFFDPTGARTGNYHLAGDIFTTNQAGESVISYADYAIALVDEIQNENFKQQRFSVYGD